MNKLADELKKRFDFYTKNPTKPDNQFLELCSFTNYQPISYASPQPEKEDLIANLFSMFLSNPTLMKAFTDDSLSSDEQNQLILGELGKNPETAKNFISTLFKSGLIE